MARDLSSMRKRRTREHIIADLSVNHVERHVLLAGYTVTRVFHDYGFDLVLSTFDRHGETEVGMAFFQVKATDKLNVVGGGQFVSCRIERAHLRAWIAEPFPVILVIYDEPNDRAYWLHIQSFFSGVRRFRAAKGSENLTIRIPIEQVIDSAAVTGFRNLKNAVVARIQGAQDQ